MNNVKTNKSVLPPQKKKNPMRYLKPSQFNIGDSITGTYLFTQGNVGKYGGEAYIIDTKEDTFYTAILSCTSLKIQMKYVKPLEVIKITFKGTEEPTGDKKYPTFLFDVEYT